MKSYRTLVIIGLGLSISTMMVSAMPQPEFEKAVAALERSDAREVEKLLEVQTLNEEQKKELLEKAGAILVERGQSIKLLKSDWNLAKIASGAVLSTVGSLATACLAWIILTDGPKVILEYFKSEVDKGKKTMMCGICSGPLMLGSGMYLVKKGLSSSTTLDLYENAGKIKELLEAVPVG